MMPLKKSFRSVFLLLTVFAGIHQAEMPSNKPDEENITANPGQTVILECRAPGGFLIAGVEWIRRNLTGEFVFFCSLGEKPNLENQHPSFKNRVELEDGDMKDGNVSVVLKNVTSNDTGTYECHVIPRPKRKKRSTFGTDPIKIIHLNVIPTGHSANTDKGDLVGGNKDVNFGLAHSLGVAVAVAAAVGAALVVGFLVFMIYDKCRGNTEQNLHQCPGDEIDDGVL